MLPPIPPDSALAQLVRESNARWAKLTPDERMKQVEEWLRCLAPQPRR